MSVSRRYQFNWDLLGDITHGRPNLGPSASLEIYRLMLFTLRDTIEQSYGTDEADRILCEAGRLAGRHFHERFLSHITGFNEYARELQARFRDMGICVFRVEKADLASLSFEFTAAEDLGCSGLPEIDYEICRYDEGFIAGLMESFTGKPFTVREVECWCTGDRTCRFRAEAKVEPTE